MSYDAIPIEAEHIVTLQVLREALAYLERLPPHPKTREQIMKLRDHLENPARRATRERLKQASMHLRGCNFTPSGTPIVQAEIDGKVLTLTAPVLKSSGGMREVGHLILDRLRYGEVIDLDYDLSAEVKVPRLQQPPDPA